MQLSVIICTHNLRSDYLERTLNAVRAQMLHKEQWELDHKAGSAACATFDQVTLAAAYHISGRFTANFQLR